jgi:hypothetical protein
MSEPRESIQVRLTPEQQALIQRLSGQHADMLELTPEPNDATTGAGATLRFRWRLSEATGIPRQQWADGDAADPHP